ncbi:MAG: DUF805 domain-containing protein [Selenomonadaceae bacterium]|nr:DUF805 domain-containing protein [Selenomonadaceae bacterium]
MKFNNNSALIEREIFMAINFCPNCGAKLKANAKFCGSCGEKIISTQTENLPPMPYENSKSVAEVKPQSVQDIFANAKSNSYNPPPKPKYNFSQDEVYKEDTTIMKTFFSTGGRLNRLRYFKRTMFIGIMGTILMFCVIGYAVSSRSTESATVLVGMLMLPCWVSSYCLNVRRLKDIGKIFDSELSESSIQLMAGSLFIIDFISMFLSGSALIAAYSIIFVCSLYILFKPGMVGSNKFGPDPLGNTRRFS